MSTSPSSFRKYIAAATLVVSGLAGGGVLASTLTANAADAPTATTTDSTTGQDGTSTTPRDESRSVRSDETLLTGTDAEQATAAALAAYPGATIQRVETDSDGVFEAHLVTADGQRLIVQLDAGFAVTGTDTGGGPHGGTEPPASTTG